MFKKIHAQHIHPRDIDLSMRHSDEIYQVNIGVLISKESGRLV